MKSAILLLFAGLVVFSSCQKEHLKDLSDDESRIYITQKASNVNFSNYETFSIADTILVVDGNNVQRLSAVQDMGFINAFKQQMEARGFRYVDRTESPDLGLQISRIIRTSSGVIWRDYYDYWTPGYWGSGYGWGSNPNWWSYPMYYETSEGMLSFDLVDLKTAESSSQLQIVWNGLIRGSGIYNESAMPSQIAQLFEQSPYLKP